MEALNPFGVGQTPSGRRHPNFQGYVPPPPEPAPWRQWTEPLLHKLPEYFTSKLADEQRALCDAVEAHEEPEQRLREFMTEHAFDFVQEAEAHAEAIASAWITTEEEMRARLKPIQEDFHDLRFVLSRLIGQSRPFTDDDLPSDFDKVLTHGLVKMHELQVAEDAVEQERQRRERYERVSQIPADRLAEYDSAFIERYESEHGLAAA